ncbi:SDR family oxidoreductase [Mycobacterium arosiense]|uniref:Short-chain dehydrogenase n=1 Tax=Mycobacterium arosiense ATCC BAA-1401 = DSM 45069 TaxID=1265311 RepID=A0A1W9Z740_MYCAI|nr:SDR family oxidoreductase [Mycobacterium arosiense]ORA08353.1 short-chain dehydrogenase [Mycobacterium arosiense ATCC BAA-1401 = DSM 45069]
MTSNQQRGIALVTGAASGIGRSAAEAFVRRGYATALVDIDQKAGREAEAELRQWGECTFFRCDVSDDATVKHAVTKTVKTYGGLTAAFNAAGIDGENGNATAECTMENWNRVIAVDLTGTWSCMRYEIPAIIETGGGSIVNCSSVAGLRAAPTVPAYTAAKHGVIGLTRTAAREYGRQGLRVNVVCPGTVDTTMFRRSMSPGIIEQLVSSNAVGRLAQADEIAAVALWLCDDAPGFLTGETITVDGGLCA